MTAARRLLAAQTLPLLVLPLVPPQPALAFCICLQAGGGFVLLNHAPRS